VLVKSYNKPLTLIGGGEFSQQIFSKCLRIAPTLIAVDSGLNHLDIKKSIPKWVIGDLDSAKKIEVWKKKGIKIKSIQEQETTDFEKCLYSFNAPYFLANAFLGKRIDHSLATISTIVKMRNKKVILLGKKDILFHIENSIELDLKKGIRLSLFPLKQAIPSAALGTNKESSIISLCFDTILYEKPSGRLNNPSLPSTNLNF